VNHFTLELVARDIQADRKFEALKERRWMKARKAMRKLSNRSR
jgi:hypothetical protein